MLKSEISQYLEHIMDNVKSNNKRDNTEITKVKFLTIMEALGVTGTVEIA